MLGASDIPRLVSMLGSQQSRSQLEAAAGQLASSSGNNASVASASPHAGSILSIEEAQQQAADALGYLAIRSPSTQAAVVAAGDVPQLVALLGSSSEAVQQAAALALAKLA